MAAVGEQSFLELLVRQLRAQGIYRLVMCSGYLAEQIQEKFWNGHAWDVEISYSREPEPMGTGGALKLAERHLANDAEFLVMNGDSFLEIDFVRLVAFHRDRGGLASMAVVPVDNAGRYGTVRVEANDRVTGFTEKTASNAPGVINAGVYAFNPAIFQHIPQGPASLERDVFPQVLARGMYAFEQRGIFIDIGTPEDYARAQRICDRLQTVASGT
jgi:NDP-sugar pyrophosphorylase family protein